MSSPMERLVVAAKDGDVEAVKRLLRRVDSPNFHEPTSGLTPLLAAAKEGHVSVVGVLLEHGASVSARLSQKGKQALHFAAQNGSVEIAELLIVAGADVNATAGGLSPLMIAASTPHTEIIHFLLEHGALLEMKGSDGATCLVCFFSPSVLGPSNPLSDQRAFPTHFSLLVADYVPPQRGTVGTSTALSLSVPILQWGSLPPCT